jgi:hypothetical protein
VTASKSPSTQAPSTSGKSLTLIQMLGIIAVAGLIADIVLNRLV